MFWPEVKSKLRRKNYTIISLLYLKSFFEDYTYNCLDTVKP